MSDNPTTPADSGKLVARALSRVRGREPTGFNIYGETMAEYYQRRTNERGAVMERAKEALLDIQDAHAADGVGMDAAIAKMREALQSDGQ